MPGSRLLAHLRTDAMCAEDDQRPIGHLRDLIDEHGALVPQLVDHVPVVHDLVAHVHGRPVHLERQLDDLDGAVDTRAEAAGTGQQDAGRGRRHRAQGSSGLRARRAQVEHE